MTDICKDKETSPEAYSIFIFSDESDIWLHDCCQQKWRSRCHRSRRNYPFSTPPARKEDLFDQKMRKKFVVQIADRLFNGKDSNLDISFCTVFKKACDLSCTLEGVAVWKFKEFTYGNPLANIKERLTLSSNIAKKACGDHRNLR